MKRGSTSGPTPHSSSPSIEEMDPSALEGHLRSDAFCLDPASVRAAHRKCAGLLMSDPALALRIADALIERVERHPDLLDPAARAVAWRCLAEARLFTGRLQEAQASYENATDEAERAGDLPLLGQILVGRVHHLSLMGRAAEAERLACRADRILTRAGDRVYLGKLHLNRGNAFYQADRYAEAYGAYRKARRVFEKEGIRDAAWGILLTNMAVACTNLGRSEEARRIFDRAEKHARSLDLVFLLAEIRFNSAFLDARGGDYRSALARLEEAELIFEQQEARDMVAAARRSRAEIYLELGMAPEALDLAARSEEVFKTEGMHLDATLAMMDRGRALSLGGRYSEAIPVLAEASAFFLRGRMRPRYDHSLLQAAEAHLLLGEHDRASDLARTVLWSARSRERRRDADEARRVLAEIALARGRPGSALRILTPALRRSKDRAAGEESALQHAAGRAAWRAGRIKEAARRLGKATDRLEDQRRLIPGSQLRARAFERQSRLYRDRIMLALETTSPRFATLFGLVERARARRFRERTAASRGRPMPHLLAQRTRLGTIVHRIREAELGGLGPDEATEMRRKEARALEVEILDQIHRAEGRGRGAVVAGGGSDPDAIAACLAPDEALIEYFVLEDRILALVLGRRIRAFRLLPAQLAEMRTIVDRARFQISATGLRSARNLPYEAFHQDAAVAVLRDLHDALLAPIGDLLPEEGRLVFVPHSFLHHVPFECLYGSSGPIDDRYLVARSPTADFLLRREGGARSWRDASDPGRCVPGAQAVLVAGTARIGPRFVESEIEAVATLFPQSCTKILRDPTREALLEEMRRSRIAHLSAHGSFRHDNPLFSSLALDDGPLFLADILDLPLSADLVVLSACESGRALVGPADDLSGFAHGFLAAGVRRLVASQWRVHDRTTSAWMEAFYRHFASQTEGDPAESLRVAQRAIREEWSHPFFWAGFAIHGG